MEVIEKGGKNENDVTVNDKSSSNILNVNSLILLSLFLLF